VPIFGAVFLEKLEFLMFGLFKKKPVAAPKSQLALFASQFVALGLHLQTERYATHVAGNVRAAGYVWGVHDAYAQRLGLEPGQAPSSAPHFVASYCNLFGQELGSAMYLQAAFKLTHAPDFIEGEMMGGEDVFAFLDEGKNFSRLMGLVLQ
jgi:hypothetical protein